jgi:hypothetical protein
MSGTAGGYLKTGMFIDLAAPATTNRMLNTLLNAAGVRKSDGSPVDNFGAATLSPGVISDVLA